MTYLRFSPADYRTLCRFCQPPLPLALDLPAFKRLLLSSLAAADPPLGERIAELDGHKLGILFDHFRERASADAQRSGRQVFTVEELRVVAEACESFLVPGRFVRHMRMSLVANLRGLFPDLAKKVARLSVRQFERLYEQVTGRGTGNG